MIPSTKLQIISESLKKEKTRIGKTLADFHRDDPFSSPDRVNDNAAPDTDAFEENEHMRIEAQEEELTTQLTSIESALEQIEQGSYGICTSCGRAIDEARLLAIPTTTLCIDCEKKLYPSQGIS